MFVFFSIQTTREHTIYTIEGPSSEMWVMFVSGERERERERERGGGVLGVSVECPEISKNNQRDQETVLLKLFTAGNVKTFEGSFQTRKCRNGLRCCN